MTATCNNCPFWNKTHVVGKTGFGRCQRESPRTYRMVPDWADTKSTDWCGQHPRFWEAQKEKEGTT